MYIEPNTRIYLLRNVPIDNTYEHSISFTNPLDQVEYFLQNYTKFELEKYYYQRSGVGSIKVEKSCNDLYDCNYLIYQNRSYSNKWFFAFITRPPEYINDKVSEIFFEIDVLQTWYFDYELQGCFVERQHSVDDIIGNNLIPERLEIGEIMCADEDVLLWHDAQATPTTHPISLVVLSPFNKQGQRTDGEMVSGLYSGLHYTILNGIDEILAFFQKPLVASHPEDIVSCYYYFKEFAVQEGSDDAPNSSWTKRYKTVQRDYDGFKNDYSVSGDYYIPRNNKLFTFPYNYLEITDWNGNRLPLQYEYFNRTQECEFIIEGGLSTPPAIGFTPLNYKTNTTSNHPNYEYTFWWNEFPVVPWNTDAFVGWLINAGATLSGFALGSVVDNMSMALAGDVGMTFGKGLQGKVAPLMSSGMQSALKGRNVNGKTSVPASWVINNRRVSAKHMKIRREFAEIIDKYFDAYGYAQHKIMIPSINVRQSWTYVKTVGCEATGGVPVDDMKKIKSIYDNGITFWVQGKTVGDYSQDNSPYI